MVWVMGIAGRYLFRALVERFHRLPEHGESLAANGDNPSHVTLKDEEVNFLKHVCNCTNQDNLVV